MNLTPRENFQRMMLRQSPQWLPLDIWWTGPVIDLVEQKLGTRNVVEAFHLDVESVSVAYPDDAAQWRAAYERIGFVLPADAEIGTLGITNRVPAKETMGAAVHLREMIHPLSVITSVDQLRTLPWADMTDPARYAHLAGEVQRIHAAGRVAASWMACTLFEWAWYLRGMDHLFGDLIEGNDIGAWLLDWFTERSIRGAQAYCAADVDVILLGDDVGTQRGMMMSVEFWREHLKPRLKRVVHAIRAAEKRRVWVFYHSDGDIRAIIGDLVEIGVDILNPLQPECMPVDEVIGAHKHHIGFWGGIGTQTTMPFGTTDDVRAAVRQLADWARRDAAVVVAPTHVLEPDVPWENIQALVKETMETRL